MLNGPIKQLRQLSLPTIFLLFSPLAVFISVCVAEDFFCVWSLVEDRYRGIWLSAASIVISSALIGLNKKDILLIVGAKPTFRTSLLTISLLGLSINGVLAAVLLLPYRFLTIFVNAPCAP